MPPGEAARSIQTNWLIPFLSPARSSPPFRTGGLYAQRYAAYPQRTRFSSTSAIGYTPNNYFSTLSTGLGSSRYVPHTAPRRVEARM